jgi:type I restriction enzyme R subunit
MSWEYSENILVQNSAGNVLETRLGWEVVFAYNTEVLGKTEHSAERHTTTSF